MADNDELIMEAKFLEWFPKWHETPDLPENKLARDAFYAGYMANPTLQCPHCKRSYTCFCVYEVENEGSGT